MSEKTKLSVRCHPGNENHHIWDNNGTFWCHLTVHLPDSTKRRLRLSLETDDIQKARRLLDSLFVFFGETPVKSGPVGDLHLSLPGWLLVAVFNRIGDWPARKVDRTKLILNASCRWVGQSLRIQETA